MTRLTAGTDQTWYVCDPENGVELFGSESEAREAAQAAMDYYTDAAASDFWHEDIGNLEWGRLTPHGRAECVERRPAEDGAGCDEYQVWCLADCDKGNDAGGAP